MMRTTVPPRQLSYWHHTLSMPSMVNTTKMCTSLGTLPMTDCCLRGTHTHTKYHNLGRWFCCEPKWLMNLSTLLKPCMWLIPCWTFQWYPQETIRCCSTSPQVKSLCLCLCAQSPGAAQADQGAVGGQDTDLARRTQRNAQVCVKLSLS